MSDETNIIDPEQDDEVTSETLTALSVSPESPTATGVSPTTPSSSETSSTTASLSPETSPTEAGATSPPADSTPKTRWSGFKYEPVRGLSDRLIARWLRAQRKNIRRAFQERGFLDLYAQLDDLKKNPRMNFMEKNRRYQEIMDEYIARVTPAPQAAPVAVEGAVALPSDRGDADRASDDAARIRPDSGGSVPQVASKDGDGIVIDE